MFASSVASIQFWIARHLAHSSTAQADAVHAFVHGSLFAVAAISAMVILKWELAYEEGRKLQKILGAAVCTPIIFGGLTYVIFWEAIPKLRNPQPVVGFFMILSACVGLAGNGLTLLVLHILKQRHQIKSIIHKAISLDNLADILISLVVVAAAIVVAFAPFLVWIDPVLTILAAIYIVWRGYLLVKEELGERG